VSTSSPSCKSEQEEEEECRVSSASVSIPSSSREKVGSWDEVGRNENVLSAVYMSSETRRTKRGRKGEVSFQNLKIDVLLRLSPSLLPSTSPRTAQGSENVRDGSKTDRGFGEDDSGRHLVREKDRGREERREEREGRGWGELDGRAYQRDGVGKEQTKSPD